ncbi:MAG TPA: PAS domain S-box protein [Gemmatimonadaceae bacterium]|nr:PAS domain S-box protein [Gemmatimonadaceae bacterium]
MIDSTTHVRLRDRERLRALRHTGLFGAEPAEQFDRLTRLASRLLGVPVTLVTLLDDARQHMLSVSGPREDLLVDRMMPVGHSVCQHVIRTNQALVVSDTATHPLLQRLPAVTSTGTRAYAGVPLRDRAGHVLGAFCALDLDRRAWSSDELSILHDLAAATEAELRLRIEARRRDETATRYETLLAQMADVVFRLDVDGRFTYLSPAWTTLLGHPMSESLGRHFTEFTHPDESLLQHAYLVDLLEGLRERHEYLGRLRTAAGGWMQVSVSATGVTSVEDHGIEVVGTIRDDRLRAAAEEAMRRSEARLRDLFDHASVGLVRLSLAPSAHVLDVNDRLLELLGLEREAFERMTIADVTHPDDLAHTIAGLARLQSGALDQCEMEQRFVRPDGTVVLAEVSVRAVRDGSSGGTGNLVVAVRAADG